MNFKYYDPKVLVPILKKMGIDSEYAYRICSGCVFTRVPPEGCFHREEDIHAPSIQSDGFCPHCVATIESSGERFQLFVDDELVPRKVELEKILRMAAE